MHAPQIELLWWEGCPSRKRALSELREALGDVGLDGNDVHTREIRSDADAQVSGFLGSPTILIDGVDLVLADAAGDLDGHPQPAGLNCRVYHRRDGRISPTPDPDDLRDALRRAAERAELSG